LTVRIPPYKRIGKISLFIKDCITGMNDVLAKESVDVIVGSFPHNIVVNYQKSSAIALMKLDKLFYWI
jgi:DNA modification methylase